MPESIRDENTGVTLDVWKDGSIGIVGNNGTILLDEYSTTNITYIGYAKVGTNEASAFWRLRVIDETGSTAKIGLYPSADRNFKYVWNNRTSYTYS